MTVQLRNNLKRFGSPTLAASVSASDYLDTFSRWPAHLISDSALEASD